ncbi:MAG: Gfo/Idh/MocA family oxidoreductase [Dyella sp.]
MTTVIQPADATRARAPWQVGLVGLGKIARDQHLPALTASADFEVVASADPLSALPHLPAFASLSAMLRDGPALDAVALCTPPQGRYALAAAALRAGKHVLLEKPPGLSLGELEQLNQLAMERQLTVFSAWHSRAAAAVAPAKAWLADRRIGSIRIDWREDVRQWHPGQQWIWQPGGLGVFDPGINALSILTELLEAPIRVDGCELWTPANRQTPIRASLEMHGPDELPIACGLDWTYPGEPRWDIELLTEDGRLRLEQGGNRMSLDGQPIEVGPEREYANLYRQFAALIASGQSLLDGRPLQLVSDALLLAERHAVAPFYDDPADAGQSFEASGAVAFPS